MKKQIIIKQGEQLFDASLVFNPSSNQHQIQLENTLPYFGKGWEWEDTNCATITVSKTKVQQLYLVEKIAGTSVLNDVPILVEFGCYNTDRNYTIFNVRN